MLGYNNYLLLFIYSFIYLFSFNFMFAGVRPSALTPAVVYL